MFDPRVHASAVALILNPDNELLMAQRGDGTSSGSGTWSIVGGWIDHEETPEQAVLRELKEEVNLISDEAYLYHALSVTWPEPLDTVVTLFYVVPYFSISNIGELTNMEPEKMMELRWVHLSQIPKLNLFKPFEDFWKARGHLL